MTFSDGASFFIGDLSMFFSQVLWDPPDYCSTRIFCTKRSPPTTIYCKQPDSIHCFLHLPTHVRSHHVRCIQKTSLFSEPKPNLNRDTSPMLAVGAFAERAHLGPILVFVFLWSTLVYDPIACWTWNPHGWSMFNGSYDFAGGTPVHISSGSAALAISIYLGKRRGYGTEALAYKPQNTTYVVLGTIFLWFGWFGKLIHNLSSYLINQMIIRLQWRICTCCKPPSCPSLYSHESGC